MATSPVDTTATANTQAAASDDSNEIRQSWLCSGPPNVEILGPRADQYPPTLNELGFDTHPRTPVQKLEHAWGHFRDLLDRLLRTPAAWDNSRELSGVKLAVQFEAHLQDPLPSDHPVYVATFPHRATPTSSRHWSFFSQGHFFHLTAPELEKNSTRQNGTCSSGANSVAVELRHEDLSSQNTADYIRLQNRSKKVPLIAYQVGSTRYELAELLTLANWVVSQYDRYTFLEKNCQMFVLSMMYRTIMTHRDCSIFIGTAPQIANWDLRGRKTDQTFYSLEHGYLLKKPSPSKSHIPVICRAILDVLTDLLILESFVSSYGVLHLLFSDAKLTSRARAIGKLYRNGPFSPGAYDPTGNRHLLQYIIHLSCRSLVENIELSKRELKEFCEDVAAGKWHDAFVGRLETRLERYAYFERKAVPGSRYHRWHLRLERFLLAIPKAQNRSEEQDHRVDNCIELEQPSGPEQAQNPGQNAS